MKYLFCGNRIGILNTMLRLWMDVEVIPIYDTKQDQVNAIMGKEFDVFVSNGCPFILPISTMKQRKQIFINIHPSLLPDLKGNSPILGAIKYKRPFGATCHLMDDGIDTGKIISRVTFEANRKNLNECYRKSYKAESDAFMKAYKRNFVPLVQQPRCKNPIYYSVKEVYGKSTV